MHPEHSGELRHALLMALVYSFLHILGPDHLGTLMTLSTVMSRERAFHVGAAWGLGHSFGMALIAGILLSVHKLVSIDVQRWEHYGNYLIGLSMVACALYFIWRESTFLVQRTDGTYVQRACACHGGNSSDSSSKGSGKGKFCQAFNKGSHSGHSSEAGSEEETQPLVANPEEGVRQSEDAAQCATQHVERNLRSAVLGIFQGLCCPMGLVGISFLAQLSSAGIICFLVVFILVSAFGTASVASGWAYLTSNGIGVSTSPKLVYRTSCCFTLVLGWTWIIGNYIGFLGKLDYTEGIAPAAPA